MITRVIVVLGKTKGGEPSTEALSDLADNRIVHWTGEGISKRSLQQEVQSYEATMQATPKPLAQLLLPPL